MKVTKNFISLLSNLKIFDYGKEKYVLIFSRHHVNQTIRQMIVAKCFNKIKKFKIIVISEMRGDESDKIYKNLGVNNIFYVSDFIKKQKYNLFSNFKIYLEFFPEIIKLLLSKQYIEKFINNFRYKNILIGDLIYDTFIRKGHKYSNLKRINYTFNFLKLYIILRLKIELIENVNKQFNISKIITSSKGFITAGNLAIRYFSYFNKKPILFADKSFKVFSKKSPYFFHSIKFSEIKALMNKKSSNKVSKYFFDKFEKLKVSDSSFVAKHEFLDSYNDKGIKTNFFFNKKKLAIIALNCFSDSPHYQGKLLFRDFYDWFLKTIEYINSNKIENTHWLIKIHPAQKNINSQSYNEISYIQDILKRNRLKKLELVPEGVGNKELFENSDNCITCVSTVGLEYACFGKKPILCGENKYSKFGITRNIKDKKKYFNLLENMPPKSLLNQKQIQIAKTIVYLLDNIKQNTLNVKKSFIPIRYVNGDALTESQYLSALNFEIKKNGKDISQDEYYKKVFELVKNIS